MSAATGTATATATAERAPGVVDGRLDFVLPDFTRLGWASDVARETWEPRLNRVIQAWFEIEWLAITAGVRRCAATMATPEDFLARAGRWAERGVSALPVEMLGVSPQPYATTGVQAEPGKPFVFRFVLGAPADVAAFRQAWEASDQEGIGSLLGYPPCCRTFFAETWVRQACLDTTWPMAAATARPEVAADGSTVVEVSGPPEANILWRWMGARAVPHLPCRFDCEPTVALGRELVGVGRDAGYGAEMDWLLEMLSWPAEWSALHGIAEIKTPVVKVSARTDATARKYVVRRAGSTYPPEGASGLRFPYENPPARRLSDSRGFQRGLDNPVSIRATQPEWYASDNGFSSRLAMDDAQRDVVDLAVRALAGAGGAVLDLGCGNGALLAKIAGADPAVVPFGVDIDPDRISHAGLLQPEFAGNFMLGDIFDEPPVWAGGRRYALAILMPGRLVEVGPERAASLLGALGAAADHLLVYTYEDWLDRFADLGRLAAEAGIELLDWDGAGRAGLARLPTGGARP